MTVVAISPHLDDAVFSVGGILARLARDGVTVTVVTVFTRTVPSPTGFALACQTDKGFAATVDYMAMRRAEDATACARLGVRHIHLDLPEAPHRGYDDPEAIFRAILPADAPPVGEAIAGVVSTAELVLAPQGLGGHVDHRLVLDAVRSLRPPLALWEDMPYAMRRSERGALPVVLLSPDDMARKLDACAAYASQLPFQFGGEAAMRAALVAEADRYGCGERLAVAGPLPFLALRTP